MHVKLDTLANVGILTTCVAVSIVAWQTSRAVRASIPPRLPQPVPFENVIGTTTHLPEKSRRIGSGAIAMIEFSDFQCPFCGQFARETFPKLKAEFIDTAQVQYAVRHFPLPMHPFAPTAANAAQCAADQSRYWPMHEILFNSQHALTVPELKAYGTSIGLEDASFRACLDGTAQGQVQADIAEAKRLDIRSTPIFLVGRIRSDGEMVDVVQKIRGAQAFDKIEADLKALLGNSSRTNGQHQRLS